MERCGWREPCRWWARNNTTNWLAFLNTVMTLKQLWDYSIIWGIFALAGFEILVVLVGIFLAIFVFVSLPLSIIYFGVWFVVKVVGLILSIF